MVLLSIIIKNYESIRVMLAKKVCVFIEISYGSSPDKLLLDSVIVTKSHALMM